MQKVERQKHKERRRGRLPAVLLCVVLLAAGITAGILLRRRAEDEPYERYQPESGFITKREEHEVKSLTVARRGAEPWTVVQQEEGVLRVLPENTTEAEEWTVDESITKMLLNVAAGLNYEDILTKNRSDWETTEEGFGLKDPLVTANICFTDETEVTVRIGNSADPEGDASYYMAVDGDDRLFLTSAGTVKDLDIEQEMLHPVPKLEIIGNMLDRITVKNGDGSVRVEWALQGRITDQDAGENWLMTVPYIYSVDYDTMSNLCKNAESIGLGTYVGKADEETLEKAGLKEPSAILELHMAAGSTGTVGASGVYDVVQREERVETLTVGRNLSELNVYVRYANDVYTMTNVSLNVLVKASPLNSLARYVAITPLNSLESVTVEKAGEEAVMYLLTRPEKTSAESQGEDQEQRSVICTRNGEEIAYDAFEAAWERLLTVTVSGKLPKEYQPGETHTKYTMNTVSGAVHTVELSDYDGLHDAVTLDGHAFFYLIKGGMTELP